VAAYTLWGVFPLYWPLLKPASAPEILAHRVLWSCLVMGVLVVVLRRGPQFRALFSNPRVARLLTIAAVLVSANWLTYIWAVNNDHVVESALGYFINPLVSVVLGIAFFGERLRRWQWLAVGLAAVAVVVLTVDYGRLPWVALVLAFSFGTYGLAKKLAGADAVESLAFETLLIAPLAAAYVLWLGARGELTFLNGGTSHALLLATTGLITALPLLCFGAAAVRIPLVSLGLLQYLAPLLQFALGVWWFHEPMPASRWAGFVLVWLALAVFTAEALANRRQQQLRDAAEAAAI
jgi:chloramphenicol-sensitive protein RarD